MPVASTKAPSAAISGKASAGCSKARVANDDSASSSPTASSQPTASAPTRARQASIATANWVPNSVSPATGMKS